MSDHEFTEEEIRRTQEQAAKDAKSNKYDGPWGYGFFSTSRDLERENKYYKPAWRNTRKQIENNS